jgi:hypothetical protein
VNHDCNRLPYFASLVRAEGMNVNNWMDQRPKRDGGAAPKHGRLADMATV